MARLDSFLSQSGGGATDHAHVKQLEDSQGKVFHCEASFRI
jgi:hypothetical protein